MARVELRIDDLARGDVPAISVKTGRPCAHPVGTVVAVGRSLSFLTRRVPVVLPIERGRVQMHRGAVLLSRIALLAAAVGLFVARPLLFGALAAYLVLNVGGELIWFGSRAGTTTDTVVLTRVHADFARAASR